MEDSSNDVGEIMIKLTLNDDKIKVGSKVIFITRYQGFSHNGKNYTNLDTLGKLATVIEISKMYQNYRVEFGDVSFFPPELQSVKFWYIPEMLLEKY